MNPIAPDEESLEDVELRLSREDLAERDVKGALDSMANYRTLMLWMAGLLLIGFSASTLTELGDLQLALALAAFAVGAICAAGASLWILGLARMPQDIALPTLVDPNRDRKGTQDEWLKKGDTKALSKAKLSGLATDVQTTLKGKEIPAALVSQAERRKRLLEANSRSLVASRRSDKARKLAIVAMAVTYLTAAAYAVAVRWDANESADEKSADEKVVDAIEGVEVAVESQTSALEGVIGPIEGHRAAGAPVQIHLTDLGLSAISDELPDGCKFDKAKVIEAKSTLDGWLLGWTSSTQPDVLVDLSYKDNPACRAVVISLEPAMGTVTVVSPNPPKQ